MGLTREYGLRVRLLAVGLAASALMALACEQATLAPSASPLAAQSTAAVFSASSATTRPTSPTASVAPRSPTLAATPVRTPAPTLVPTPARTPVPTVATPAPTPAPGAALTLQTIDGRATLVASDGTYLGIVSSSRVAPESICNNVGIYGSNVGPKSVRNKVGLYGSTVSPQSAYNSVTPTPPAIIYNGAVFGYLTKNTVKPGRVDPDVLFAVYGC